MRVLVNISSLRVGGAEAMALALANGLDEAGVTVAIAGADGPLAERMAAGVKHLPLDNVNRLPLHAANQIRRRVDEFDPGVIHSHGAACAVAAALATRGADRPARVLTHHSRSFWRMSESVASRVLSRCADHFVAISGYKERQLLGWGVGEERVTHLPNFLDTRALETATGADERKNARDILGVDDETPVVCMAGRVIPAKGFDRFVAIVSRAATRWGRDVHGVVVGDGPALAGVKKTAEHASENAHFHFTGYVADVSPWLAACDAVLFPTSHPEVLPMFLIEAAAAARPAVCSAIDGNREVVTDGQTGVLVDGDDEAFAARLVSVLADDARRRELGEAARRRARDTYDTRVVVDRTMAVYETAIAHRV